MTDRIQKVLSKLTSKECEQVRSIVDQLLAGDVRGLDIRKLVGHKGVFRARKGNLRIIFASNKNEVRIIAIERRSEKTYRGL